MHKYELLRLRAEEFRATLEKYAKEDPRHKSELEWFIGQWMPWYEKVMSRQIRLPDYSYKLGVYFTNPDLSKMADTYHYETPTHPLGIAHARFNSAIKDWYSDPAYIARLKASGELPDQIPDEPPPPEEETPLLSEIDESSAGPSHRGWLYRWIFGEKGKSS